MILLLLLWKSTFDGHSRSWTWEVSKFVMSDFKNVISLRAFSRIIRGSCAIHRRQFGAKTIAKLAESIFVWLTTSGAVNCCKKLIKYVSTCNQNIKIYITMIKNRIVQIFLLRRYGWQISNAYFWRCSTA